MRFERTSGSPTGTDALFAATVAVVVITTATAAVNVETAKNLVDSRTKICLTIYLIKHQHELTYVHVTQKIFLHNFVLDVARSGLACSFYARFIYINYIV